MTAGAALAAGSLGCRPSAPNAQPGPGKAGNKNQQTKPPLPQGIDLEKWNRIKGKPYQQGSFGQMPGVCKLPGPQAKRNWPDR
ncbi:MAG: hypothetical protein GY888_22685, partial [Planctomycetaceae bacterium]|nr:hypothetical protein [Planctomycetaceae bacterium]